MGLPPGPGRPWGEIRLMAGLPVVAGRPPSLNADHSAERTAEMHMAGLSDSDIFVPSGLLSGLTPETEDERAKREGAARNLVGGVFQFAVLHLGEDEARRVWKKVAQRKRGARPGSWN